MTYAAVERLHWIPAFAGMTGVGRFIVIPAKAGIQYDLTMSGAYYVYLVASGRNGTLYIGVTNNLGRRIMEHRSDDTKGFTSQYGVHRLVHIEVFQDVQEAIAREKALKKWNRAWKLDLIERDNPEWKDLFETLNA